MDDGVVDRPKLGYTSDTDVSGRTVHWQRRIRISGQGYSRGRHGRRSLEWRGSGRLIWPVGYPINHMKSYRGESPRLTSRLSVCTVHNAFHPVDNCCMEFPVSKYCSELFGCGRLCTRHWRVSVSCFLTVNQTWCRRDPRDDATRRNVTKQG